MDTLDIQVTSSPVGLFLQLDPALGTVMELVLYCSINLGGSQMRKDIWLQDASQEVRDLAQQLIEKVLAESLAAKTVSQSLSTPVTP